MEVVEKPPATDILFATYPSGCRSLSQRPYAEVWVEVTGAASPGLTTPAGAPSAISSPPARHPVWVPVQKNNAQLFMSSLDSQQIHSKRLLLRLCCLLLRFALLLWPHGIWPHLSLAVLAKEKVCALPQRQSVCFGQMVSDKAQTSFPPPVWYHSCQRIYTTASYKCDLSVYQHNLVQHSLVLLHTLSSLHLQGLKPQRTA